MSRDEPLLLDMLIAAGEALTFVAAITRAQFAASKLHQNAVKRDLDIIWDASCVKLPELIAALRPLVPGP